MEFQIVDSFYYLWIGAFTFFVSIYVLNIQLGHIFGLLLFTIFISYFVLSKSNETLITNEDLAKKMDGLLGDKYIPKYLYKEPDFILLYDSIKNSLGSQNEPSFYKIITLTDQLLLVLVNLEQEVCSAPTPPDILLGQLKYREPSCTKGRSKKNCMTDYYSSREIVAEILNRSNELILNSKLTQTTEYIFLKYIKRLRVLLKRTLNRIRANCKESEEIAEKIGFMPVDTDPFELEHRWQL